MKKMVSLVLACVMAFGMALPTFAVDGSYSASSSVELPTVKVTIPATSATAGKDLVLNPYKMKVNPAWDSNVDHEEQIIFNPRTIINNGDYPVELHVLATASVADESNATIANASLANSTATTKQIFLFAEFQKATNSSSGALTAGKAAQKDAVTEGADGYDANYSASWTGKGTYNKASNQVVFTSGTAKDAKIGTMKSGESMQFRVFGDMTKNPTEKWSTNDTVNIQMVFSFIPTA